MQKPVQKLNGFGVGCALMLIFAAACGAARPVGTPAATLPPGVQIEVQPAAQINDVVVGSEDISQDNCAGNAAVVLSVNRVRNLITEIHLAAGPQLDAAGGLQLSDSLRDLPVGSAISQKHNASFGATTKQPAALDLSAPANTYIVHSLQQVEHFETGLVIVRNGSAEAWRDTYGIRTGFDLREVGTKTLPCDGSQPTTQAAATSEAMSVPIETPGTPQPDAPTPTADPLLVESTPTPASGTPGTPIAGDSAGDGSMEVLIETPDPNRPTDAPDPTEMAELVTPVAETGDALPSTSPSSPSQPLNCEQANPFNLNAGQLARLQCSSDQLVRSRWVVYQRFERGFLILFDGPTNSKFVTPNQRRKYYAMADDGRVWRVFYENEQVIQITSSNPNDWYSPCAAQEGRGKRPEASGLPWRGFGRVWCDHADIKEALGRVQIGRAEEQDRAAFQSYSEGRVFQFRNKTYAVYLNTGGADVGNLTYVSGSWEQISAQAIAQGQSTNPQPAPAPVQPAPAASSASTSAGKLGGNRYRISSKVGWQDTGLYVNLNSFVAIRYVAGQWRINPQTSYTNHEGNPTAKYARNPMPALRSGVLICRIGGAVIEPRNVSNGFRSGAQGPLACRINDDRLDDNDGSLDLSIDIS